MARSSEGVRESGCESARGGRGGRELQTRFLNHSYASPIGRLARGRIEISVAHRLVQLEPTATRGCWMWREEAHGLAKTAQPGLQPRFRAAELPARSTGNPTSRDPLHSNPLSSIHYPLSTPLQPARLRPGALSKSPGHFFQLGLKTLYPITS